MINRLNFYDLYGYLLPGFILLFLLWLPFGWIGGKWPSAEWSSAAAALGLSYAVGFIVQQVATKVLPSKQRAKGGEFRYPSDFVLDTGDGNLSDHLREALVAQFEEKLRVPKEKQKEVRDEIFRLCRAALLGQKSASYAEQFQGLYALSRGLLVALALAGPYYAGWCLGALGSWMPHGRLSSAVVASLAIAAWILLKVRVDNVKRSLRDIPIQWAFVRIVYLGAVVIELPLLCPSIDLPPWVTVRFALPLLFPVVDALREKTSYAKPWSLMVTAVALMITIGFQATQRLQFSQGDAGRLAATAIGIVLALVPLWQAYERLACTFAVTIYRDFYVSQLLPPKKEPQGARNGSE